jgi:hypothetical protein
MTALGTGQGIESKNLVYGEAEKVMPTSQPTNANYTNVSATASQTDATGFISRTQLCVERDKIRTTRFSGSVRFPVSG